MTACSRHEIERSRSVTATIGVNASVAGWIQYGPQYSIRYVLKCTQTANSNKIPLIPRVAKPGQKTLGLPRTFREYRFGRFQ